MNGLQNDKQNELKDKIMDLTNQNTLIISQ